MTKNIFKQTGLAVLAFAALTATTAAFAAGPIKIAVTDLTYEERVSEYFRNVTASSKGSVSASGRERESDHSYSASGRYNAKHESSYSYSEGYNTYIDRGELRNYTADLKGALLKSGAIRVVQGRPYPAKPTEKIHDIIGRIKQGLYAGSDYVLFGTVSNITFRQDTNQIPGTSSITGVLALDLVVDFSLINTRTYEVKAAFSASGAGQDTKIVSSRNDRPTFNRGKVVQETSRSLAEAAYNELIGQLGITARGSVTNVSVGGPGMPMSQPAAPERQEPVTIYK